MERKHRHLLDTTRAIKLYANLPNNLWSECILTATYLVNRMPTPVLAWKSPFQVLFHTLPTISHLRTVGCLCYAAILPKNLDKFAPKGQRCVFLGYPPHQKGYKLLNLDTYHIFTSRDVIFHEHMFPFKSVSSTDFPPYSANFPTLGFPASPPNTQQHAAVQPHAVTTDPINPTPPGNTSNLPIRKSIRQRHPPPWLHDFVLPSPHATHLANSCHLTHNHLFSLDCAHIALLANLFTAQEPGSYDQAAQDPMWVAAMEKELHALEANQTWQLTTLPKGHKALPSRWVYKLKYKADGSIDRPKARLVIKGFNQQLGVDYKHTFAPVAKLATVRTVIALAAAKAWPLHQLDVNNAFLHGFLDEDIFMTPPQGYHKASPNQVCKLQKSLYGLKQASRQWNLELSKFLLSLGFTQSSHDFSLFVKSSPPSLTIALVYVDDILLTGSSPSDILSTKSALHSKFTIKDLGLASYFLGMELCTTPTGIFLNQRKYIVDLLTSSTQTFTTKCPHSPLPVTYKSAFTTSTHYPNSSFYRKLIGKLLYLSLTCPDIAFATHFLSQFLANPTQTHFSLLLHLLHYLQGTISFGLFYPVQTKP